MPKTAAILIGGQARRLGGIDKSQVEVAGQTILARQMAALRGIVTRVVLVGRDELNPDWPELVSVPDDAPGHGSLGGLCTALRLADGPMLALACDMPFVTRAFVAYLFETLGDHDAVVPRTGDGRHPLCAVYGPTCLPAFERRLAAGQLKLMEALAGLRVRDVGPDVVERFDPAGVLLTNVNTPDDLARALGGPGGSEPQTTS